MPDPILDVNDFRIFILGAGFSRAAGLPLADSVWREVMARLRREGWLKEELDFQLNEYNRYRRSRGENVADDIDFENFLAFLDIDHALGLQGSDQFSGEGDRLQLVFRWLIAQVIVERTPEPKVIPKCSLDFAELLQPHDRIITFNYDTLLERALVRVGKPYRLFTFRYHDIGDTSGHVDTSQEEIVVLKLHGSVDWFDRASYAVLEKSFAESGLTDPPDDLIFGPQSLVKTAPLLEGPQFPDDPLRTVHRVFEGLNTVYRRDPPLLSTPFLLAPSSMKVLYANRLRYFFWGLGQAGGMNLGVIVVGYSLPTHDDYARRILMHIIRNYQGIYWDDEMLGMRKKPVLLIDYRESDDARASYEKVYGFSDTSKTTFYYEGFDDSAVSLIKEAS